MVARLEEQSRRELWQHYMADGLMYVSKNTAMSVNGSYLLNRFYDVLKPPEEDERSGEEIVVDVITRAGLVVI